MPDEAPSPVITTPAAEEARMRGDAVADIQVKARKGPAMSPERYREIFGGPIADKLAVAENELARIEVAILKDNNPRTNNHVAARRRVEFLRKQLEPLVAKHNG